MVRTDKMETRYTEFSNILIEATEQMVPVETKRANQRWMTNEIPNMMEERRLLKHNQCLYRQKDAEIHRECHKEKMLSQQCYLIEQLDATNQSNLMHAHIRKTIGARKGNATTTFIEDKDDSIIMDQDKIRTHWFEYISELYTDDSRGQLPHITPDTADITITSEEIQHALKRMPMKKAPGSDGVLTEMLVVAGEYGLEELTMLTNMVYNHGYFPEELNKSIFITLPKISGITKCEKHRTISLMSHITS